MSAAASAVYAPSGEMRGGFDQIIFFGGTAAKEIVAGFKPCLPEAYVSLDSKKRGDAVNHDLYGYDPAQNVAVIQCRHFYKRRANHYPTVHKTYVLAGYNEHGTPFRHPISAHAIRGAIRAGEDAKGVVRAAQRWMWSVTDKQLDASIRQGDVLLVPERGLPRGRDVIERGERAVLAGSHEVLSPRIVQIEGDQGRVYALNPRVRHIKGQHEPIGAIDHDGWYSVRVASEASAWDFSARLGD